MKDYGINNSINLKLMIALRRGIQKITKNEALNFNAHDITPPQFSVLETLYHKGELRVSEIIDKTLSTAGNITVVINNLYKTGYVNKYQDINDKRSYLVSITDKGTKLIEGVWPQHLKVLEDSLSLLNNNEKEDLILLLKKLNGIV